MRRQNSSAITTGSLAAKCPRRFCPVSNPTAIAINTAVYHEVEKRECEQGKDDLIDADWLGVLVV